MNWTVPDGTQAMFGHSYFLRFKPEAMIFFVPNGTLSIN